MPLLLLGLTGSGTGEAPFIVVSFCVDGDGDACWFPSLTIRYRSLSSSDCCGGFSCPLEVLLMVIIEDSTKT